MERHSQWNIDAANGGPITCILCCHHELAVVLCTVDVHTINFIQSVIYVVTLRQTVLTWKELSLGNSVQ